MTELLNGFSDVLPHLKTIALAAGVVLGLIAAAATVYILRTAFGPLWLVILWMIGHTPGKPPGELVAGIVYGARILAWSGVIGVAVWLMWFVVL